MEAQMKSNEYKEFCLKAFTLISKEYEQLEDLEQQYPKLIIMCEFFRLLRGEAFTRFREPTPEFQTKLYKMEDILQSALDNFKKEVENSEKVQYNLKMFRNMFEI